MPAILSGMDAKTLLTRFKARFSAVVSRVRDVGRMLPLAIVAALALWIIATPGTDAPEPVRLAAASKLGIFAWLICKESALAYLGYWIDRLLHPDSRPGRYRTDPRDNLGTSALDVARMAAEKRRAFIVSACLLAGGLIQ